MSMMRNAGRSQAAISCVTQKYDIHVGYYPVLVVAGLAEASIK